MKLVHAVLGGSLRAQVLGSVEQIRLCTSGLFVFDVAEIVFIAVGLSVEDLSTNSCIL